MQTAADLQSLNAGAAALGVRLGAREAAKLRDYLALLGKWNLVYNLTALREPERWVTHHLLDSLSVVPHLPDGTAVAAESLDASHGHNASCDARAGMLRCIPFAGHRSFC